MSLRRKPIVFEESWATLRSVIIKLFDQTAEEKIQAMELLQLVYEICVAYPQPLTRELQKNLAYFLAEQVSSIRQRCQECHGDQLLKVYSSEWSVFSTAVMYLNGLCHYLNRTVEEKAILKEEVTGEFEKISKMSVEGMAFMIWKEGVVYAYKNHCQNELIQQILIQIEQDRNGEVKDYKNIHYTVNSLILVNQFDPTNPLELYLEEFENLFIQATKMFYEKECSVYLQDHDVWAYMKRVFKDQLEFEARYFGDCQRRSRDCGMQVCINQMVGVHQKRIQDEFNVFLQRDQQEEMGLAYTLLVLITDGIQPLLESLSRFILLVGRQQLSQEVIKDPAPFVTTLLSLHSKYSKLVNQFFARDTAFEAAMDKAFRTLINESANPPSSELVARYCDNLLKKNTRIGMSESEVDEALMSVMVIFKYIDDKDVFQQYYSRLLAKRLVNQTSLSMESEASMISRMKTVCGYEYTSKLQKMFTDMTLSQEVNHSFAQSRFHESLPVAFSTLVLTAGAWPITANSQPFLMPTDFEACLKSFESFYCHQHNGRKLTWLHHLAKCDIRVNGFDRRYELSIHMFQACILLLFNDATEMLVSDIEQKTRLPDILKNIRPLLDLQILITDSELSSSSLIKLNTKFQNKRAKIKINAAVSMESQQEKETTLKAVDEDRRLYLQASIVRIMKSRKELGHNSLIQEIIDQAKPRFAPNIQLIKKCIEQLIEKQYLERSNESKDCYVYIA